MNFLGIGDGSSIDLPIFGELLSAVIGMSVGVVVSVLSSLGGGIIGLTDTIMSMSKDLMSIKPPSMKIDLGLDFSKEMSIDEAIKILKEPIDKKPVPTSGSFTYDDLVKAMKNGGDNLKTALSKLASDGKGFEVDDYVDAFTSAFALTKRGSKTRKPGESLYDQVYKDDEQCILNYGNDDDDDGDSVLDTLVIDITSLNNKMSSLTS